MKFGPATGLEEKKLALGTIALGIGAWRFLCKGFEAA